MMTGESRGPESRLATAVFIKIVLLGAWLRLDQIWIKPFHHDEGVNAHFLLNLARDGHYQYNPTNYHGPTLYYFALAAVRLFGETDFALRLWPALAGTLTILLVWGLRRKLGTAGTLAAAFGMALSPGLVYFSRDFIHEMSFGLFTLGMIVGSVRYIESNGFGWMVLTAVSSGLLFATKESAILTVAVVAIAFFLAMIWDLLRSGERHQIIKRLLREIRGMLPSLDHATAGLVIFVFINILFYSSFMTHWKGVADAVESVQLWSRRAGTEHVKGFWYYFAILLKMELPLLCGSVIGGILIVWKGSRFWLVVGAWAMGMALAYSIIGYKTPWLAISFIIPMALVSGYAFDCIMGLLRWKPLQVLWAAAGLAVAALSLIVAWRLNFEKYDDNSNRTGYFQSYGEKWNLSPWNNGMFGYVYAQTDRELLELVDDIRKTTGSDPAGNDTGIYVASPDYWPLPWYLRDYRHVAYTGGLNRVDGRAPVIPQSIIIGGIGQRPALDELTDFTLKKRVYILRPGVSLLLLTRK